MKLTLIATTVFGIESVTARELIDLGYTEQKVENGRVTFEADEYAVARCNINLRTAERVLIKMGEFRATTFEELFQGVKALDWDGFLPFDCEFPVEGRSVRSKLFSISDCQAITKKAIVEKMKTRYNVEIFPETGAKYKIEVALLNDIATLTIDTTGPGLNKRGYRSLAGEAPIKETLASAMILLSHWRPGRILVDPLCGSGTIPIEAALMAKNMAPGIRRSFICEKWENFPADIWTKARNEALSKIRNDVPITIYGSDLDPKAIDLAKIHAEEAGVDDVISLKQMNVNDLYSKESYGFIITNPPYGERIGDMESVKQLYKDISKVYRRLDNWSLYLITSYADFERVFGKKADKRRKLYNGRLLCQYYQYLGAKPVKQKLENEQSEM